VGDRIKVKVLSVQESGNPERPFRVEAGFVSHWSDPQDQRRRSNGGPRRFNPVHLDSIVEFLEMNNVQMRDDEQIQFAHYCEIARAPSRLFVTQEEESNGALVAEISANYEVQVRNLLAELLAGHELTEEIKAALEDVVAPASHVARVVAKAERDEVAEEQVTCLVDMFEGEELEGMFEAHRRVASDFSGNRAKMLNPELTRLLLASFPEDHAGFKLASALARQARRCLPLCERHAREFVHVVVELANMSGLTECWEFSLLRRMCGIEGGYTRVYVPWSRLTNEVKIEVERRFLEDDVKMKEGTATPPQKANEPLPMPSCTKCEKNRVSKRDHELCTACMKLKRKKVAPKTSKTSKKSKKGDGQKKGKGKSKTRGKQ